MNELINTDETIITLKEITDLLEVRHDKAMIAVAKMSEEPMFGLMSKFDINVPRGNNGAVQTIQTYSLTKK